MGITWRGGGGRGATLPRGAAGDRGHQAGAGPPGAREPPIAPAPHAEVARATLPPVALAAYLFPAFKFPTRRRTAPGRLRPKGGGMARRYETVYIFDPALEDPAINEKLEKFHAQLTKDGKGSITNVAHWGKRTLAFPIKKKDSGHYVLAQFDAAAALLPQYQL